MILSWLPLLILVLFRFYHLDARPIHHDEAVNGWFVDGVFDRGYYIYDPENYHGPFYFYVLALFEKVFGRNISTLRLPAVIFGSLLTFSPLLFKRWLGPVASFVAVAALAVSPAMVFYSRYSIHETGFVLSCVLFYHQWLRIRESGPEWPRIVSLGVILGIMASLKENFVVFGAALGICEVAISLYEKKWTLPMNRIFWGRIAVSFAIAFAVIVIMYTGFFQDADGVAKFFRAFMKWSKTGSEGNGHQKPFGYWFELMAKFEWPALLGVFASFFLFFISGGFARYTVVLGLGLTLIYSIISYKTPWCILGLEFFLVLSFAVGFARTYQQQKWRIPLGLALILASIGLGARAYEVAYQNPDQDGHPYIYGQTYRDFMGPVNELLEKVRSRPEGIAKTRIIVLSSFTWPLPYLLGEIKQTGYYGESNAPAVMDADFLIIDEHLLPKYESRIQGQYRRTVVRSRQWASKVVFLEKVSSP